MRNIFIFLLLITLLFDGKVWGQLSITSTGTTYTQDFNTLAQSGTTNAQSGGIFNAGWLFLESPSNANQNYAGGSGSIILGDTYSLGVAGVNTIDDRALGMLQSGSLSSIIGFEFTNNTGSTVSSITIGYTGEVWRQNIAGDSLAFSYQLGDVALNAFTGFPVCSCDFFFHKQCNDVSRKHSSTHVNVQTEVVKQQRSETTTCKLRRRSGWKTDNVFCCL